MLARQANGLQPRQPDTRISLWLCPHWEVHFPQGTVPAFLPTGADWLLPAFRKLWRPWVNPGLQQTFSEWLWPSEVVILSLSLNFLFCLIQNRIVCCRVYSMKSRVYSISCHGCDTKYLLVWVKDLLDYLWRPVSVRGKEPLQQAVCHIHLPYWEISLVNCHWTNTWILPWRKPVALVQKGTRGRSSTCQKELRCICEPSFWMM